MDGNRLKKRKEVAKLAHEVMRPLWFRDRRRQSSRNFVVNLKIDCYAEMTTLVYDCNIEWLKMVIESGCMMEYHGKAVKWQRTEEVRQVDDYTSDMEGENVAFRMLVLSGGVYKEWIEIRRSGFGDGYGLFALTRFEKGSIITMKIPYEGKLGQGAEPQKSSLHLGCNWVARKTADHIGPTGNAVYLEENGLLRSKRRIMPGSEIVLDEKLTSDLCDLKYLDALVYVEKKDSWNNWQDTNSIGRVISGDRGRGYMVKYHDSNMKTMNVQDIEKLALRVVVSNTETEAGYIADRSLKKRKQEDTNEERI